jgi:CubicO group peptidase (beta-lactamase class C family)
MRFAAAALAVLASVSAEAQMPTPEALKRAQDAALPGQWTPPPITSDSHHAAAYAQRLCSAIFVAGLDADFARTTLGDFNALAPVAQRIKSSPPIIDRKLREVRITAPGRQPRIARQVGSQGCVVLAESGAPLRFKPARIAPLLPDAATTPWPMGDRLPTGSPVGLDMKKIEAAVAAAFTPEDALTQAFVVTWRGQIVGERYSLGASAETPLEGWSMGKSVVATLLGVLIQQGVYTLDQAAPIPGWQTPGDERRTIRIRDIMQMSSGLRIRSELDPDYVHDARLPDHYYYYTAPDAFAYAASRGLEWKPGTVGRYRNTDPVLGSYLVRLAVEGRGENYHAFPQRALFDHIGIRTAVLETDASGNFLMQGAELMSARDWARLANLYLQDGVWAGKRILPVGFVQFVSTPAPAWVADGRPNYGGFFWINRNRALPLPEDAYYMVGAGGQLAIIVPSHDLVIVRLGRYAEARVVGEGMRRALTLLAEAVPSRR